MSCAKRHSRTLIVGVGIVTAGVEGIVAAVRPARAVVVGQQAVAAVGARARRRFWLSRPQWVEAHDLALKAAETDATKRALVTFGKAFGLALYAGAREKTRKERQLDRQPLVAGSSIDAQRPDQPIGRAILQAQVTAAQVGEREVSPWPTRAIPRLPQPENGAPTGSPTEASSTNTQSGVPESNNGEPIVDPSPLPAVRTTELRLPVDKSALSFGEPRRVRDKTHLRHVAAQPCLLRGALPADAHHVRFAQPKAFGRKVSDEFTVPLCRTHHRELHHTGNERAWWHDMGIDPLPVAARLWHESHAALIVVGE